MSSKHRHLPLLLSFLLLFTAVTICIAENTDSAPGLLQNLQSDEHILSTSNGNSHFPLGNPTVNNGNAYLYGVFELYTKLDTVMKLIENGFGKTNERVDMMEQKLSRLELTLSQLDRQLKTIQTSTQYVADRFEKIYNVHTETYTICKEAVINFEKGGILKGVKQPNSRTNLHHDIIVENGDRQYDNQNVRQSKEQDEEDNILYVISAVANMTAQRFYNRIERKVDEEFNAIDFQLRNELIASVANLSATTEHLIKGSDKIIFGILDMRDRLADEQTMISQMESKLTNKFDHFKYLNENVKVDKVVDSNTCKCPATDKNFHLIEEKLRMLLEDYFGNSNISKLNEIDNSVEATEQSFPRERIGKDAKTEFKQLTYSQVFNSEKSVTEKSTTERPTTKPPINFVTISMGQNVHSTIHRDYSTNSNNMFNSNTSQTELVLKPEFRPTKISQHGCTTKSFISYPKSCAELRLSGATCDSVYVIILRKFSLKHVYCDQRHLMGGWTVLLRRGRFGHTKQITFDHTYPAYRSGFGDMHLGEFFLGLDTIHQLTSEEGPHVLQIDMEDTEGEVMSLQYNGFRIGALADEFRLYVDGVRDDDKVSDAALAAYRHQLATALLAHNGSAFLTADRVRRQLDAKSESSKSPPSAELSFASDCAQAFQAGWWYGGGTHYDLPFGVTKNDACRLANTFHLMAPLDRFKGHQKSGSGNSGSTTGFRAPTHYFNYQSTALAQHSQPPGNGNAMAIYWSKWTRGDGSPRILKYVLMKMRPAKFRL